MKNKGGMPPLKPFPVLFSRENGVIAVRSDADAPCGRQEARDARAVLKHGSGERVMERPADVLRGQFLESLFLMMRSTARETSLMNAWTIFSCSRRMDLSLVSSLTPTTPRVIPLTFMG